MRKELENKIRMVTVYKILEDKERVKRIEREYPEKGMLNDIIETALELNSMDIDTIIFLFGENGGLVINDGVIIEV